MQELSEYLAQPYRGPGGDSLDRRPESVLPQSQLQKSQSLQNNNHNNNSQNNISQNNQLERPHLTGKSWYYGAITRNQCDTVLNGHGHDGDYLIRDSETNVSEII